MDDKEKRTTMFKLAKQRQSNKEKRHGQSKSNKYKRERERVTTKKQAKILNKMKKYRKKIILSHIFTKSLFYSTSIVCSSVYVVHAWRLGVSAREPKIVQKIHFFPARPCIDILFFVVLIRSRRRFVQSYFLCLFLFGIIASCYCFYLPIEMFEHIRGQKMNFQCCWLSLSQYLNIL